MAIPTSEIVKLVNEHSGLVLEIEGESTTEGTRAEQYTDTGKDHQRWRLKPAGPGNDGFCNIENVHSAMSLEVVNYSKKPGAEVVQRAYGDGPLHRQWELVPVAGKIDVYKIVNRNSGLVLDDEHGRKYPPAPVKQYAPWNDDGRQQWKLIPTPTTTVPTRTVRGSLYAWGWNSQGAIGDGTTTSAPTPAQVEVLHDVQFTAPTRGHPKRRYIDAGGSLYSGDQGHSLALDSHGAVWAWGANTYGQLASSDRTYTATPAKVTDLTKVKVVDIAAGGGHSLALDDQGAVWAWGWNNVCQLGENSRVNNAVPHKVSSLENVKVTAIVAGGGHSLALDTEGAVWAWGWDNMCQLGNDPQSQFNDAAANSTAAKVSGLAGKKIVDIAAGGGHNLALDDKGVVWTWGWNNKYQLGDGKQDTYEQARRSTVTSVSGLDSVNVIDIAAGQGHSLALDEHGVVYSWGWNNVYQLGHDNLTNQPSATSVSSLADAKVKVVAISAGGGHSLALDNKGVVWTWGWNNVGQLGNGKSGDATNSWQPTEVQGLLTNVKVMAIDAGQGHSLAIGD